ncbi:uncharacterized protein [Elaeis guineensis]|uniref:Uncharacterized protein LOC105039376 n=1 Tax=Elaeis guineensis var. tenera TaxID=51953 RepID=A0A6I9QV75_ELAGV|nr:uncharacterized protein LOC105039376 [Elaeis guineensis]
MGSCFSSSTSYSSQPTAKVVAVDGSLKEYSAPVPASDILGEDGRSFFICSADRLYFDSYVPALGADERLQLDQIYFVLPNAKLEYPLTGLEMAALAAKASSALSIASRKRGKDRRIRVVPVAEVREEVGYGDFDGFKRLDGGKVKILAERSMVVEKKVGKGISMRGRMRSPRYRGKLSTIEEGNE